MHDKKIDELCDTINEGLFGGSMPTRPTNTRGHRHQTGDTLKAALKYQSQVEKVIKKKKKKAEKKQQRSFDRLPNANKLQWLRKSRNESAILAGEIDILLEATGKAHSWPKGGGKICAENFVGHYSDDPEYKSKLEKAQKFNQQHNKETMATLANNPKLKDKPTLQSSDDEDAAYMEPNENEITHKTGTKKTGTGKISDATKAKTQAFLKKFRQQQAQKKQSRETGARETGALDTANRTKHNGNLDAAGKLKRIVSVYKKHGKDALTSSELQTLITAIKKAKSKRQ